MKTIKNFSNYLISKEGYVISKKFNKKMKPSEVGEKGYEYHGLILVNDNGQRKNWRVNRLVWTAFNGIIPKGFDIHHIDENKFNNKLDNLECITKSKNCLLRKRKDVSPYGRSIVKRGNAYRVTIYVKGENLFRKTFYSHEDAISARDSHLNNMLN